MDNKVTGHIVTFDESDGIQVEEELIVTVEGIYNTGEVELSFKQDVLKKKGRTFISVNLPDILAAIMKEHGCKKF